MVAPAPKTLKTDVCITKEPICFGSFEYTFHPPAHRSVYADLHVGMCLTFGTMHYFVDSRLRATRALSSTSSRSCLSRHSKTHW